MTRALKAAMVFLTTLGTLAIGGQADACSCFTGTGCPTQFPSQIIFVATAHVQKHLGPDIHTPTDESDLTWHDDFRVSVDVTVVGRKPGQDRQRTTLIVERAVRGAVRPQYQIDGGSFGTSCDYYFMDGEQYLVYATPSADGSISTSTCSLTKPLRQAGAELAYLAGEGTPGLSGIVRGYLQFYDRKRRTDSITVVLERPDGERLFEIEARRFDDFDMYPVPPGPYVLSVHLNESDKAVRSKVILVAPGQCMPRRIDLAVGTYADWSSRRGPRD